MTGKRRRVPILGWIMGIGLFVATGVLIHLTIGWTTLLAPWRLVSPGSLVLALLLVMSSYAIRTIRIHRYFAPATSGEFLTSFRLVLLHNLFNNLLPMRSGEASFPILMKRNFAVPFQRSVPGLFYLRALDLHYLLLLGSVVFAWGGGLAGWIIPIILFPFPLLGFVIQGWMRARIRGSTEGALSSVSWLDGLPATTSLFWATWFWTAVNWSVKLFVFAWILVTFSPMAFPTALLGSVTGELSSVLPIHGVAGAGTYEAGVMAGLLPLGVDMEVALRGGVNLHLFVLGASILSGALALVIPVGNGSGDGEAHSMDEEACELEGNS